MTDLVRRFGNDCDDSASPQSLSGRLTGVGLVATEAIGARTWPALLTTVDCQVCEQMLQHRAIVGLTGTDEHDQGSSASVDEVMNLAGQPATGTANAVVTRLAGQIRVIRPSPLCHE